MIESPEGLGATDEEITQAIDAQVAFFQGRGQSVEWKTYADDAPADLLARLEAAGFVADDVEVVLLGEAAAVAADPVLPDGVSLREFSSAEDWDRVSDFLDRIWGAERSWVTEALRSEQARSPELYRPVLAQDDATGQVVSNAALRLTPGCDFAGLWGGSTLPEYRGRGIYRALTAYRARIAMDQGYRFLRVDTSPDSRPILTRLGLQPVTTTTPCVLRPE